jgi:hypothetical protein
VHSLIGVQGARLDVPVLEQRVLLLRQVHTATGADMRTATRLFTMEMQHSVSCVCPKMCLPKNEVASVHFGFWCKLSCRNVMVQACCVILHGKPAGQDRGAQCSLLCAEHAVAAWTAVA